ncbi:LacI family DNA-binding transcriptional regulator [Bifidobacterium olomucense]|uniref:Transcriptional regulator, lacI type n=1 Tax=Bifidobacterium olomucense TaxID=2675324 RepID=A0A7Y0EXY0_9BIFI|nr:LacI family DNA-binding transcriptional regulator [Bifidobacterium sp. DSM 109959]NMM98452.1 Transcriptional regulator, lacI type [Bifidobacterium sp. DSM 109959]
MPDSLLVTIKDVARDAGVSAQTVSNVINTPEKVRPATRQLVLASIQKLGYKPNASARRLRTSRSNTVALGIHAGDSPIFDRFLHALAAETDTRDLRILLYKTDTPADEITHCESLLATADVDAFILTDVIFNDPRPNWLRDHHQNFALFGRPWGTDVNDPTVAWVDVDGRDGIRRMTQHLILHGHRNIAFIGWREDSSTGQDRLAGWRDAMTAARIRTPEQLETLFVLTDDDMASGQQAYQVLQRSNPDIDAVVCVSDTIAAGVYMETHGDITITGFDDTPISRSLNFSSVAQPLRDIAKAILDSIQNQSTSRSIDTISTHMLLPPQLIIR